MFGSYHIGRVFGIPVKIHITLIIVLPILALQIAAAMRIESLLWGLVAAIGLFASVALHELGHSVVALSKGVRVRQILLLPIGGLAQLDRMPEDASDEIHIAIAGPIVSLGLALFFYVLVALFGSAQPGLIVTLFGVLFGMNLILALFNLLPSFPMDGGRVFRAWLTPRIGRVAATRIAAKTGRYMAMALGLWGLLQASLLTLAVAVFIYMAAGAEYRMVVFEDHMRRRRNPFFGFESDGMEAPNEPDDNEEETIRVSPPPYARSRRPDSPHTTQWWAQLLQRPKELFDGLFKKWSGKR